MPPLFTCVPKRTTTPAAHRSPSPNTTPKPPFETCVPWKYSAVEFGIPLPRRTSVSAEILATRVASKRAPCTSIELAQPRPAPPTFPHGHAVAVPSPAQYWSGHGLPVVATVNVPKLGPADTKRPSWNVYVAPQSALNV